ncbi:MAG: hypothetical protein VST64_07740 [Nitrospirota bacterium]|nr:hypothetical protein [Nitrospirota bacterium]
MPYWLHEIKQLARSAHIQLPLQNQSHQRRLVTLATCSGALG